MKTQIRLFARARDLAGRDVIVVDLADGACVADLRRRLAEEVPSLAALLARSALAIDEAFVDDDAVVLPGAEIALLPPVSGG